VDSHISWSQSVATNSGQPYQLVSVRSYKQWTAISVGSVRQERFPVGIEENHRNSETTFFLGMTQSHIQKSHTLIRQRGSFPIAKTTTIRARRKQ